MQNFFACHIKKTIRKKWNIFFAWKCKVGLNHRKVATLESLIINKSILEIALQRKFPQTRKLLYRYFVALIVDFSLLFSKNIFGYRYCSMHWRTFLTVSIFTFGKKKHTYIERLLCKMQKVKIRNSQMYGILCIFRFGFIAHCIYMHLCIMHLFTRAILCLTNLTDI